MPSSPLCVRRASLAGGVDSADGAGAELSCGVLDSVGAGVSAGASHGAAVAEGAGVL